MKRPITLVLRLTTLFAAASLCAQSQFRAFQAPPRLKENAPPAGAKSLFAFPATAPQTCDPQGSVSRDGSIVTVTLNYVLADFKIFNPNGQYSNDPIDPSDASKGGNDHVRLRSYGGCQSGPLIEIRPGNTLRVNLNNGLSKDDPSCRTPPPSGLSMPPGVGCFNTVNLHTHGLHVSPTGNSDNVLLNIAPQTSFPFEINIPSDHPSGTFWYHAHRHGSTALQVASGASGVLVVRGDRSYTPPAPQNPNPPPGDIDTILHDAQGAPIPEQLFLFQQIAYACFANDPGAKGGPWQQIFTTNGFYNAANANATGPDAPATSPWICPPPTPQNFATPGMLENFSLQLDSPTIWDMNGRFTSVNGIVQPTMTVPAGQIQRWRFVHAGIHDTINLQVVRAILPGTANVNLIASSSLSGDRRQQKDAVMTNCAATESTLVPQFEIATDGLTRTHIRTLGGPAKVASVGSNYMQPGYRSDVLIVFPEDGDYCLLDQSAPFNERARNGAGPGGQGPSIPQLLAYIHVQGGHPVADPQAYVEKALYDANPQLPESVRKGLLSGDLTPWAPFTELAPPTPGHVQHAGFNITSDNQGVYFQVNGLSYNPDVINITRQVNTTDDWILSASGEPHIFHIHVNPFEVMDVTTTAADGSQQSIFDENGVCKPEVFSAKNKLGIQYCGLHHVFRDTIFVENNYQVHIRTHYDRYIGEFVIHCHILDHEDSGMMLNIEIVPDLSAPGGGLGMAGMKHTH
jgi:FtsP/CotA-like multicopper oxidase with cupredoxin domain